MYALPVHSLFTTCSSECCQLKSANLTKHCKFIHVQMDNKSITNVGHQICDSSGISDSSHTIYPTAYYDILYDNADP